MWLMLLEFALMLSGVVLIVGDSEFSFMVFACILAVLL